MSDLLQPARDRASAWLEPIPGAAPAGVAARLDPEYQAVAEEVGKLDAVTGGEVDWKKVTAGAGGILTGRSKDVVVAAYLAHALHVTGGVDGLATGAALLADLLDRYWDTAFPEVKRLRGRVNAVQWFLEKTLRALDGARAGAGDGGRVATLDAAARRLAEVVRARFADQSPAFGPLLEAVGRLTADVEQAAAPPPPPPPPAPAAPQPAAATTSTAATIAAPAPAAQAASAAMPAPVGALASVDAATDFLRDVGGALASAAATLRRATPSDPLAYRLVRTGVWLHLSSEPPAEGGKTSIPPPAEDLRAQLKLLAQNQRWAALLEETESALGQQRFWLDLHRMTAQALAGLGAAHDRAREAVAAELRTLLIRMPALPTLAYADGTPFADAQTRSWLEEEIAPKPGGAAGAPADDGAALDPAVLERLSRAKKLFGGGQAKEALAEFQAFVATRPGGRAQFRARLDLARACAGAGLTALAKATYEELDREAVAHGLDAWEPALAAECLKGLVASARALSKDPRGATQGLEARYQRLCRLDPAAAHEVWP